MAPSGPPSISGNGRFVVFASAATNLVAGDTNAVADIFLRDRDTDADGIFDEAGAVSTTRLSLGPSAAQADGPSSAPVISADGRYVAFVSTATNLVAGANAFEQIYRVDRTTGDVVRVSENVAGEAGDAASATPVIDANGDVIAFQSMADNLDGGANAASAIFVRAVTADLTTRITPPDPTAPLQADLLLLAVDLRRWQPDRLSAACGPAWPVIDGGRCVRPRGRHARRTPVLGSSSPSRCPPPASRSSREATRSAPPRRRHWC